jgi:hypothetical protein
VGVLGFAEGEVGKKICATLKEDKGHSNIREYNSKFDAFYRILNAKEIVKWKSPLKKS